MKESKLIIVRFDETKMWDAEIRDRCGKIYGYYLIDVANPFHQCSLQLDVQGHFLYNRLIGINVNNRLTMIK